MAFKVGVVDFDFPPHYRRAGAGNGGAASGAEAGDGDSVRSRDAPPRKESSLRRLLGGRGIPVADPGGAASGLNTPQALARCIEFFRREAVDCLLIELYHWSRIPLIVTLIRELDLPAGLYARTDGGWNGITAVTAASGSLREAAGPRNAMLAERFRDTEPQEVLTWLRAIAALKRLRRSRLLLWGGSYGADIPFTRSDPSALEQILVREVLTEQELVLVDRAERILARAPARAAAFRSWLEGRGAAVRGDGRMLTRESFDRQIALYLAARDRLRELEPEGIAGAAVKCHFELSTGPAGLTACLIPAFLPFGEDAEGPQAAIPVACEGDLNGLASLAMLHALNPDVPPLFGDLAVYGADHILVRNCGASSVYWAARSGRPERALPGVELLPNLHGRSGAAVHYETPEAPAVTFARLFRAAGTWHLFAGEGRIAAPSPQTAYPDPWPHTRLRFPSDPYLLFQAAPCNHGSLTEGRLARELEVLARYAGIRVVRCDRDDSMVSYLENLARMRWRE